MSDTHKDEEQAFQFDKFVKDFEKRDAQTREKAKEHFLPEQENANREYFKRYQEDWRNSTHWRR